MEALKFDLTDSQKRIVRAITKHNGEVWVVGGAVRDRLLGLEPKDLDLVTNLTPVLIRRYLVAHEGMQLISDRTAWDHGICRIASPEGIIDLATMRRDVWTDGRHASVEFTDEIPLDLARRDLTINAMAAQVSDNEDGFFDLFHGREDLKAKVIRFVGKADQRVQEDWLRMVRACRFTALEEGWHLSQDAVASIEEWAPKISLISKERIRDEILKALSYPKPSNFFRNLHATGLLRYTLPLLSDCIGVEQNEHHAEDCFEHAMYCVDASVEETENVLLRLATLMHDVGKVSTRSVDRKGDTHFFKHEIAGAIQTNKWMEEHRFSKREIKYVTKMIHHHQWRFMDDSKDKAIKRWLREVGEEWYDLVTLRIADRRGNMAKQHKPAVTKKMRELIERVNQLIDSDDPIFDGDLAINGNDLKDLGLKPGPVYQQVFQEVWALVLNEPSKNTKETLTDFIRKGIERGRF
jgi:tRNA nucleotidyltransferase/poly(A) polymerase